MKRLLLPLLLGLTFTAFSQEGGDAMPERWVYFTATLGDDAGLEKTLALLKDAKACGCTHALLIEGRWLKFPDDAQYHARVEKVKALAKEQNVKLIPSVFSVGYSGRYFHFDPNLIASTPVKNMPFIVKGKSAAADNSTVPDVKALKYSGNDVDGTIDVQPFMHYRLTFKLKGKYAGDADEFLRVTATDSKRWISRTSPQVDHEKDEQDIIYTFNTLESKRVRIWIHPGAAKVENLALGYAGTLLMARRPLIPLTVASEDGKTVYEEGKDFQEFRDPDMLKKPFDGEFTIRREPAELKLTENSRIKDGDKLKLSFWHGMKVGSDQEVISMEDPRAFEVLEQDLKNCIKVWKPDAFFLNYDEIRVAGWEPQVDDEGKPLPPEKYLKPGEMLAKHFKKAVETCRKHVPNAAIYTWSDMFSPHHNARPHSVKGFYYMVNGNWDGSWEGVAKDVGILNWYAPNVEAVKFFSDRGHAQILCGYYDAGKPEQMKQNITNWMKMSDGLPNIRGFMYTTWKKNYNNMKPYFELVDTYAQWGGAGKAKAEKEPGVKE
ncbi:MAG TPA: hypothetical protein VEJ63_11100 [Planctomycetota bacterium]|nr:hypothetical protein [Planctomycetota bacterium]